MSNPDNAVTDTAIADGPGSPPPTKHVAIEHADWPEIAPFDYWEERYRDDRVWSGAVNPVLADVATGLPVGAALDLGCGEGADAIWLAQHGWQVTAIDISPAAIARAALAARRAGVPSERVTFRAADLSALAETEQYQLVTASFLHSPVALPREQILRTAAYHVATGGYLLITSHASLPPRPGDTDSSGSASRPGPGLDTRHDPEARHDGHQPRFLTPAEQVDELGLDAEQWAVRIAELRSREVSAPGGAAIAVDDSVVLMHRRRSQLSR